MKESEPTAPQASLQPQKEIGHKGPKSETNVRLSSIGKAGHSFCKQYFQQVGGKKLIIAAQHYAAAPRTL